MPPSPAGATSGIRLTSLVLLGAVGVAIAAGVLELPSRSPAAAAADADALDAVIREGTVSRSSADRAARGGNTPRAAGGTEPTA